MIFTINLCFTKVSLKAPFRKGAVFFYSHSRSPTLMAQEAAL